LLTSKAFALLDAPITPPNVFISYKQEESSSLALLVEARLKLVERNIHIFIDKLFKGGDNLEGRIRSAIKDCRYFVCLLAPNTLVEPSWVKKEIGWALEEDCTIIPICHNGFRVGDGFPAELKNDYGIIVEKENAEQYELAMIKLLNSMDYSTI
jgi:hypothetical protein